MTSDSTTSADRPAAAPTSQSPTSPAHYHDGVLCDHDHSHDHHGHHHHAAPGVTMVRQGPKIGRNDPCPCGSGKKHKKCCLDAGAR